MLFWYPKWSSDLGNNPFLSDSEKSRFQASIIRYLSYLKKNSLKATYDSVKALLDENSNWKDKDSLERIALRWFFSHAKRHEGEAGQSKKNMDEDIPASHIEPEKADECETAWQRKKQLKIVLFLCI